MSMPSVGMGGLPGAVLVVVVGSVPVVVGWVSVVGGGVVVVEVVVGGGVVVVVGAMLTAWQPAWVHISVV